VPAGFVCQIKAGAVNIETSAVAKRGQTVVETAADRHGAAARPRRWRHASPRFTLGKRGNDLCAAAVKVLPCEESWRDKLDDRIHSILPPSLAPRGLSRTQAAEDIRVRATKLDEMIKDGWMPKAKRVRWPHCVGPVQAGPGVRRPQS
jgi:hypothetical protein